MSGPKGGKGGKKAWRTREDVFIMAHALLTSTLEKLEESSAGVRGFRAVQVPRAVRAVNPSTLRT